MLRISFTCLQNLDRPKCLFGELRSAWSAEGTPDFKTLGDNFNGFFACAPKSCRKCQPHKNNSQKIAAGVWPLLIECFRGRHGGGRNFTSVLRFSRPFCHAANWAISPLTPAPTWRQPLEAPLDLCSESNGHRGGERDKEKTHAEITRSPVKNYWTIVQVPAALDQFAAYLLWLSSENCKVLVFL